MIGILRKNTMLSIATLATALTITLSNAPHAGATQVLQKCQSQHGAGAQASALFRSVAKCARAPACRKEVAMRTERMAKRLVKLMADFATGTMEQISELIGGINNASDSEQGIAGLDRLESLLKQNGALTDEVQREIDELRAALRN